MKNHSKSYNNQYEYEDVYLENLDSKEYFEYLIKYYYSWKKTSPSEFSYLFFCFNRFIPVYNLNQGLPVCQNQFCY